MGCDIHLYVEKKVDGDWVTADKWTPDKCAESLDALSVDYDDSFYHGRNYQLFSILADVRNGSGFAGCDTGDCFTPIAAPKGLPDNASAEVKREADSWDSDGHSHSYLTVQELLNYDWTQVTKRRGWVDAFNYAYWVDFRKKRGELPEEFCGGVSGGDIQHVTEEEMQRKLAAIKDRFSQCGHGWRKAVKTELVSVYCPFEMPQYYYQSAKDFLGETLPRLLALGRPDDVRIVFWFDN